jgi:hypothetical protein
MPQPVRTPSNDAAAGRAAGPVLSAGYRGLGDDPLDGTGTARALDAAAEATVDLLCAQRLLSRCRHHVPYLVVTQYITRADDHSGCEPWLVEGKLEPLPDSTTASEKASTNASCRSLLIIACLGEARQCKPGHGESKSKCSETFADNDHDGFPSMIDRLEHLEKHASKSIRHRA